MVAWYNCACPPEAPMKIRVSLFFLFLFTCAAGVIAMQDETQDYFLPYACGGAGSKPEPGPIGVTTETLRHHRTGGTLPVYPEAARKNKVQGTVDLNVEVNKEGTVSQVTVLAGNPTLARSAARAVKKWKYHPVLVDGNPLMVTGEVLLTFSLGRKLSVREGGKSSLRRVACGSFGGEVLRK